MHNNFLATYIIFLVIEVICLTFFVLRQREKFKNGSYNPRALTGKQSGDFRDSMIYFGIIWPPGIIDIPMLRNFSIVIALSVVILTMTIYNLKSISLDIEHKRRIIIETIIFDLLILSLSYLLYMLYLRF